MGRTVSQHLTFPFWVKDLPADHAAIAARILDLERRVFLLGRWVMALAVHFLLPEGRLPWVIYSCWLALCLGYTITLLGTRRPGRRITAAMAAALGDYGMVVYLIVGTGGLASPLQLLLPVLFFRNQLLLHGLPWAKGDGLLVLAAWLVSVKAASPWLELVQEPQSWAYLTVLGACAGLSALLLSGPGPSVQPAAPARPAAGSDPALPFSPAGRARLLEEAPDWIFVLDGQGRFVYLNRQFETLFPALRRDLYLGHRLQELVWPPDETLAEDLVTACQAQEKNQIGEVRFALAGGGVTQVRLHLKPLLGGRDHPGLLGVGQELEFGPPGGEAGNPAAVGDKTAAELQEEEKQELTRQLQKLGKELHLAEEQVVRLTSESDQAREDLEKEIAQTDQILAALAAGVVQVGPDFRVRSVRGPAREWFGPAERLRGLPCATALWRIEPGPCPDCQPPAAGSTSGEWEACATDSGRNFQRRRLPRSGDGDPEGGWLELIQLGPSPQIAEVQEIVAAPKPDSWCLAGRVAGGLAHEFNNIFSAISGFAVLAEEDANYVRDLVQTAKEQSRRGERLNLSLLNLVRDDLVPAPAGALKPLLEELVLLVEHDFLKHGLRLRLLPAATPPVRVNPGRLRRALLQLLFAFSDALPKETELVIQTRASEEAAEVLFSCSPPLASEQLAAIAAAAGPETGSEWSGDDNLEIQPEAEQVLVRLPLLNPT